MSNNAPRILHESAVVKDWNRWQSGEGDSILVMQPSEISRDNELKRQAYEESFSTGATREIAQQEYLDGPLWALKRIGAITYEGKKRYGPRNWRKGMPKNETFNHIMNHLLRWAEGDKTEDNLAKAAWGVMALMVEEDIEAGIIQREVTT